MNKIKTRQQEKEDKLRNEMVAIEFVKEIQEQFTEPIIKNLDKFLNSQNYDDIVKADFRKSLMITIANSILIKSGASKTELKQSYKGLIADYIKIKK